MNEPRPWRKVSVVAVLVFGWALSVDVASASAAAVMDVTPDFFAVPGFSGSVGGPFSPSSVTYTVTN